MGEPQSFAGYGSTEAVIAYCVVGVLIALLLWSGWVVPPLRKNKVERPADGMGSGGDAFSAMDDATRVRMSLAENRGNYRRTFDEVRAMPRFRDKDRREVSDLVFTEWRRYWGERDSEEDEPAGVENPPPAPESKPDRGVSDGKPDRGVSDGKPDRGVPEREPDSPEKIYGLMLRQNGEMRRLLRKAHRETSRLEDLANDLEKIRDDLVKLRASETSSTAGGNEPAGGNPSVREARFVASVREALAGSQVEASAPPGALDEITPRKKSDLTWDDYRAAADEVAAKYRTSATAESDTDAPDTESKPAPEPPEAPETVGEIAGEPVGWDGEESDLPGLPTNVPTGSPSARDQMQSAGGNA